MLRGLSERLAFFVVEVTLFDAVTEAFQRTRLVRMSAVDENSRLLALEGKPEIHIAAEAVRNIHQAELVQLIVNLGVRMLKHMLLTLKNPEHRTSETTWAKCHTA